MPTDEIELTEGDIDRMMLESYGVSDSAPVFGELLGESVSLKPRLFGVDGFLVFDSEDAIEHILKDGIFRAVMDEVHEKADSEGAYVISGLWSDGFVKDLVRTAIGELTKGEALKYDEFFRTLDDKYGEGEFHSLKCDDSRFAKMPNVVRIQ